MKYLIYLLFGILLNIVFGFYNLYFINTNPFSINIIPILTYFIIMLFVAFLLFFGEEDDN